MVSQDTSVSYVEFRHTGHTSVHLSAFVEAATRAEAKWHLFLWVSRAFLECHRDLVNALSGPRRPGPTVEFCSIDDLVKLKLTSGSHPIPPELEMETILMCEAASMSEACYIASLDQCLRQLAFGSRSGGVRRTGTLLYANLHYPWYPLHRGKRWPPSRGRWLKSYLYNFVASHRHDITRILTIDPLAPDFYNRVLATRKYRYLPDYVDRTPPYPRGREQLGLPEDRLICSFLGVIDERKGALRFLAALEKALANDAWLGLNCAFVFAGAVSPDIRADFNALANRLKETSQAPIAVIDDFIPRRDFVTHIAASDVIAIPYPRHTGMSSLLLQAAAYGKLVIGPEYGTVGEMIRHDGMGENCDPLDPAALSGAVSRVMRRAQTMDEAERSRLSSLFQDRSLEEFGACMVDAVRAGLSCV